MNKEEIKKRVLEREREQPVTKLVDLPTKLIYLTIEETAKEIFLDLKSVLVDDILEYPQKEYAYLLHKKDFEELRKKWLK